MTEFGERVDMSTEYPPSIGGVVGDGEIRRDAPINQYRVATNVSAVDTERLHRDDIFKTWMPSRLLVFDILLMVLVWVAIGTAEGDTVRPWVVELFAVNRDYNLDKGIESILTTGTSSITTYRRGDHVSTTYERVQHVLANMQGACDVAGTTSCSDTGMTAFAACVSTELLHFSKSLKDQAVAATDAQKDVLRQQLWGCGSRNPVPHQMRPVARMDLLVLLALWYGVAIYTRGVCNYAHTPFPNAEETNYQRAAAVRRMVQMLHPFTLLLCLGPIIYSIVRMSETGAAMDLFAVLTTMFAFLATFWVSMKAWRLNYVGAVTSVYALSNSTALSSEPGADYGFNASWVTLCLIKPMIAAPIFTTIVLATSGMLHFDSMLHVILLVMGLTMLSSVLSYYNLYATHRKWLISLTVSGTAYDPKVEHKAHRPVRVVTLALLTTAVIAFTPWPRRHDIDSFWPVEFSILFLFFGLATMVLPDIIFHRRYMNALMTRERGELLVRVILTLTVANFVFKGRKQ